MLSNLNPNTRTKRVSFARLAICLATALWLCPSVEAIPVVGAVSSIALPFGLNLGDLPVPTGLGLDSIRSIAENSTTVQQRPHTVSAAKPTVQLQSRPLSTAIVKTVQQTFPPNAQASATSSIERPPPTAQNKSQIASAASFQAVSQKAQSFAASSSSADVDNKYARFRLTSNQASYGPSDVRADLRRIMAWASDIGNLDKAQEDETVAAIMSVAARYYPELPTRAICRVLMADIKAESDFRPRLVSPGRLDSGDSWGLMQVSPDGQSQELNLFKNHARTAGNSFSWVYQPSKGMTMIAQPGMPNAGPLLDWKTGQEMDLASLTKQDLFRPWINIHVASWIQSNLARTSSEDPSGWDAIARASQRTTISAQQLLAAQQDGGDSGSDSGGSLLSLNIAGIKVSIPNLKSLHLSDLAKQASLLVGGSLPRSVRTGLGSWVAGPATTGEGSFEQNGDDISKQYLRAISDGVGAIYKQTVKTTWLNGLKLNAGLVDYRP
ncbi:hypothetical protein CF319_g3714 [Tilletia indica]|nr:hypothetical protein CF319_g3714 [Tilletia indica]